MNKKQYTAEQHYIPQFILRNFISNKLLTVADVRVSPVRYFKTTPKRIFFQNDLYEIKNEDGTYFDRNAIEDRFASMEGWVAPRLRDLFLKRDKSSHLSGEQDAVLAVLIAVQLARLPAVKQIVFDKNDVDIIEKNYIYQAFVNSPQKANEYLKRNNIYGPPELLKDNENKTLIDAVASHLLSDCFFYIIDASSAEEKFIMADQPVLIRPYEDAQYIFPVSPNFAIACCTFTSARGSQAESFVEVGDEIVHKINELSYKLSDRFVIAKAFTENHRRILEDKDDE